MWTISGREKLLKYVPVLFEQEAKEFADIMADDVHFQALDDSAGFDGLMTNVQADDVFKWQNVSAAQIIIRIRRRKSIKMGAADGGEEQRVRLGRDDAEETRV